MDRLKAIKEYPISWLFLGCVPLFFFLRGIHLIITGGGWIASTDQIFHWLLLSFEIIIAAISVFGCVFLWHHQTFTFNKKRLKDGIPTKIISIGIIFTFIIHFVRVGFWLQHSV
jgi:hypothetical protein